MPQTHAPTDNSPDLVSPEFSTPVQDIISADPGYLVRNGTVVLLAVISLVISGLLFIRYPDRLEGNAILTTNPSPLRLRSAGGRIQQLFVADGAPVHAGTAIAELENTTGYNNIMRLQQITDSVFYLSEELSGDGLNKVTIPPLSSLGEAQPAYNRLRQSLDNYRLMQREHILSQRTLAIRDQSRHYKSISAINHTELSLGRQELEEAEERFRANESLYKSKVISKQEYYEEVARLRQKQLVFEQQHQSGIQSDLSEKEHNRRLMELLYNNEEKKNEAVIAIREALGNLQSFISTWKLRYLIIAPVAGRVQFLQPLSPNETVPASADLFMILPSSFYYAAQVAMPATGLGKVKAGQRVHLYLNQFPASEYGYLEGIVSKIGSIPQTTSQGADQKPVYRLEVKMLQPLITTYGRQLTYTPEMAGKAHIITRDRNLLQRLIADVVPEL